ncbi:histidine kinase [Sporocytophaga myxococcoides]|uniref:histidine kinase n=1 Tax=Sporocytophaga myxococcoides TaxID=153721 RepID=A0A098L978_9BACT|nr:response regulator [Sporocytophaga myxococcoides]GAL83147.1 histidine kinase [Sporocytophaga myxococcoides]
MFSKPKILIVDDKQENLIALETVLRDLDVEIIRATSGNEALKQTLNHDFSLALIDIQMPEMDGYELAAILREDEKTASLPFIFISGIYTDHVNVFKGYDRGAFSFITKPFQPEILINKVKLFIGIYHHEYMLKRLNDDLERKNEELRIVNKELEAFTYSVSHDLRAPLRVINGYSQIILKEHADVVDEEVKRLLNIVGSNVKKMGDLIDNLLSFSKIGKREVNKDVVNMDLLVKSCIEEMKATHEGKKVNWIIAPLHPCFGDSHLLNQVMINFLSNAVKYSSKKEQPIVEITSDIKGEEVIYSIKDNGVGFDMKYYKKLFGVFQRLHRATEFEGTGVGLAIIQRIVMKHHGRVWAESSMDNGANFFFSVPAVNL